MPSRNEEGSAPASEPTWSKKFTNKKDVPYWVPNIDTKITPEVRHMLETYAGIAPSQVRDHVYTTREKAWEIRSYPCTGMGNWLTSLLPRIPVYETVIARLKAGHAFLDVGCFMGQDLRRLVIDGSPQDRLYALDIVSHWEVGYEFFRDRDRFTTNYITDDILDPSNEATGVIATAQSLTGFDIINVTLVLHQWDWKKQLQAAENLCRLSRPGTMVVGYQCGTVGSNLWVTETTDNYGPETKHIFWQSPSTWEKMWAEAGKQTGTQWKCQAELRTWEQIGLDPKDTVYLGEDMRMLQFVMTRVE